MRRTLVISVFCAVLWVACNGSDDHCATYAETCERWCEGDALEACQLEGEKLAQEGDQATCFDANLRLTCGGEREDTDGWEDSDDWEHTGDTDDLW
jgi:hypothetical protein